MEINKNDTVVAQPSCTNSWCHHPIGNYCYNMEINKDDAVVAQPSCKNTWVTNQLVLQHGHQRRRCGYSWCHHPTGNYCYIMEINNDDAVVAQPSCMNSWCHHPIGNYCYNMEINKDDAPQLVTTATVVAAALVLLLWRGNYCYCCDCHQTAIRIHADCRFRADATKGTFVTQHSPGRLPRRQAVFFWQSR